jgi:hypothetical protein
MPGALSVRNSTEYPQGDALGRIVYDSALNRIVIVKQGATGGAQLADSNVQSIAATGSVLVNSSIVMMTGTATYVLTLPATASLTGRVIRFKKTGASGVVTITPTTGTIDGAASLAVTAQWRAVELYCDGTNFFMIVDATPIAG